MRPSKKKTTDIDFEFVEVIPNDLDAGVLYISVNYDIMMHLCACGCGMSVSSPISESDWSVTYHGESVSVYPSIGNWDYPCRSHYWIRRGKIKWADAWSDDQIVRNRRVTRAHGYTSEEYDPPVSTDDGESMEGAEKTTTWERIINIFSK